MTRSDMSRRTMLKGATALTTLLAASGELAAQQVPAHSASSPAAPLPPRGEFVIRGATVLTMDPAIGDFASGDVHVRDGAIVAVAPRIDAPNAQVIDGRGMICMPGFIDTHWHLWTSLFRPFIRSDVNELGYFPVTNRLGAHHDARGQLSQRARSALPKRLSAGVTTVHNWAHNVRSARSRRRRARRHARHRNPRPLRLRSRAGHAGRPADGSRRPRAHQARLDAERRHAHARHLLAQHRRHEHRRRNARNAHDRA